MTSSGTLDKENPAARKYFAERADLLGAVRLSEQTFQKTAGTNAVTDILFLQKRDRAPIKEPSWVQLGETSDGCSINQYYIENPEMILGDLVPEQNQYGETSLTVKARKDLHWKSSFPGQSPVSKVPCRYGNSQTATWTWKSPFPLIRTFKLQLYPGRRPDLLPGELPDEPHGSSCSYSRASERHDRTADTTRTLLKMQLEDSSNEEITKQMKLLNQQYDAFTAKWGLINSTGNQRAFSQDASYYLLSSLEVLDEEGNLKEKADIFRQRTIRSRNLSRR